MKIKLPGFIQISYAPDGPSGGGAAPSGGGSPAAPAASPAPAPSGGSDASPAAAPSSPSGAAPSGDAPVALPDDPFAGMGGDGDDAVEEPSPAPKPVAAQPPAPVVDPKAPPVAPATPAVPEAQPPAPAAAPATPGPSEASQPPIPTPGEPAKMGEAILANLEAFADHLATTPDFAMSPEDIEAFNTDMTTALPKFAARVFLRAQASALNQMERVVPAVIERYMKVSAARDESSGKFYSRWPQLNKQAHGGLVDRMARTFRAENPKASLDEMVEALGPYVMMAAKVPFQQSAAPNGNQQPHPASSPLRPTGNRPPPSPFVPATGGPAAPPQAHEDNPWMGLGGADIEE